MVSRVVSCSSRQNREACVLEQRAENRMVIDDPDVPVALGLAILDFLDDPLKRPAFRTGCRSKDVVIGVAGKFDGVGLDAVGMQVQPRHVLAGDFQQIGVEVQPGDPLVAGQLRRSACTCPCRSPRQERLRLRRSIGTACSILFISPASVML